MTSGRMDQGVHWSSREERERAIGLVRPTHSKVVYYFFICTYNRLGGSANKL